MPRKKSPSKTQIRATAAARAADESKSRLLSRREVLDLVNLSYPTIWCWMRDGKFPRARQVGGKIFWIAKDVEDWIANLPPVELKGDAAS